MLDFCENQNQDLRTVEWCWTALIPLDNFAKHVTGSPETGTTRPPLPAPAKAELCQENLGVFSTPLASKVYLYFIHCCFTWDICGARLHNQKRLRFFESFFFFSPAGERDTEPRGKASAQDLARRGPDGDRDRAMAQLGPSALRFAHRWPCTEIFARPQRGRSGSTQPQRLTFTQRRHAARAQRSTPRCSFDPSQ